MEKQQKIPKTGTKMPLLEVDTRTIRVLEASEGGVAEVLDQTTEVLSIAIENVRYIL